MHLMIPFASAALSEDGLQAVRGLGLPSLSALLARMVPMQRFGTDEDSLSTPFERALAAALGWQGADGCLPWAAQAAVEDGIDPGEQAWGLLTPVHWHVASDHISVADPQYLHLSATSSQTLFEAVRGLFESEGWRLAWGSPTRWYAAHDSLTDLPCASLERVIGQSLDRWLPAHPQARLVRRLQNETQMLLYQHPLNDERVAQGALPVNSFWLSGCGRAQSSRAGEELLIEDGLRAPLHGQDVAAWADAWRTLDDTVLRDALRRAQQGETIRLTLAGERQAQDFESAARAGWWKRLMRRSVPVAPWLEAL